MFRLISNAIWGKPAQKTSTEETPASTFNTRLEKIKYTGNIPSYFICPISLEIMEDPWIVNSHESHTFDKENLDRWLTTNPTIDPLKTTIIHIEDETNKTKKQDIKANTLRKQQIEEFVSCLERIHELEIALATKTETITQELKQQMWRLNLPPEEFQQLMQEQLDEQIKQIKLALAIQLEIFISLTESVISVEDKSECDKKKELRETNGSKLILLNKLREELQPHYPLLFTQQPVILELDKQNSPDPNPESDKDKRQEDVEMLENQPLASSQDELSDLVEPKMAENPEEPETTFESPFKFFRLLSASKFGAGPHLAISMKYYQGCLLFSQYGRPIPATGIPVQTNTMSDIDQSTLPGRMRRGFGGNETN